MLMAAMENIVGQLTATIPQTAVSHWWFIWGLPVTSSRESVCVFGCGETISKTCDGRWERLKSLCVCDTGLHWHGCCVDVTHRLNASGHLFLRDGGGGGKSSAFELELRTNGEEKWFH